MTQQETKDKYWEQFLKWCEEEKAGIDPDDEMEAISIDLNTRPTDENFWNWYMEHIA